MRMHGMYLILWHLHLLGHFALYNALIITPPSFTRRRHFSVVAKSTQLSSSATNIAAAEREFLSISDASLRLEPLLTSFLLRAASDGNFLTPSDTNATAADSSASFFRIDDAYEAMLGLVTWESSLRKGRLPLRSDFDHLELWPEEPLFTHVHDALSNLALQRLVRRHPEVLTSVSLGVAKTVVEFICLQRRGTMVEESRDDIDEDYDLIYGDFSSLSDDFEQEIEYVPLSNDELERLAESLSEKLALEWSGVARGVSMLDSLFGYDHQMLNVKGETGFGLQDGIWQHKGWEPIPSLQKKLSQMPELRKLLSQLGRRPSTEGRMTKFAPRKRSNNPEDMLGVEIDRFDPTSVSGLCYSSSLTTMLPSEAVFLQSRIKALRLLFLAKKAESKLLSYELSGYTDINTLPLPRKRKSVNSPSARGGPIIICLDTSWSMSGLREQLAKAVVLASVQAATRQGRECRVISFSSTNNAIESGIISCDAAGVRRLLEFLQSSFGGGTDVTGALKYLIETDDVDISSSDIILVSDGEIPNPPVSNLMMAKLESIRQQTGMEIHGLLVGKKESPALSSLCTDVHHFLVDYELRNYISMFSAQMPMSFSSTTLYASQLPKSVHFNPSSSFKRRYMSRSRYTSLYAVHNAQVDEVCIQRKREGKVSRRRQRFEDDDEWEWGGGDDTKQLESASRSSELSTSGSKVQTVHTNNDNFVQRLEDAHESVQNMASDKLKEWQRDKLDGEIQHDANHPMKKILSDCTSFIEWALVERDKEAKLVVLGMISQEHVLFIGPPGTSKSELGRRLSQLCGGPFFQRLFTKFTTPEEIFGPLSLRALENDEYLRCIDGFLPTATVAFLDEIFKANSSILNTLLTILNERQFDNGAGKRVLCPLKCVIGASNELPESEELDALLDRFMLRAQVNPVSDDGLMKILSQSSFGDAPPSVDIAGELDQVISVVSSSINDISLGQNICALIQKLRSFARDELNMYISDRRLVKASRLLRVSASTHGRSKVDLVDCLLLENICWQLPEQQVAIREWLLDNLTPGNEVVEQSRFLLSGLASEALAIVKKTSGDVTGESGARTADLEAIKSVKEQIEKVQAILLAHAREVQRHIDLVDCLPDHLWIDMNSSHIFNQHLAPLASAAAKEANKILMESTMLQLALTNCIENDVRSPLIEMLMDEKDDSMSMFTEDELEMSLKEAKRKYDGDMLQKWKSARRKQ